MENILIIGGSGYLGRYLIKELKNEYRIYCHINKKNITETKIFKEKFNIFNKKKLEYFLQKNKIVKIINLASLANVEQCQKKKKYAYKLHVKLLKDIGLISKKRKIKVLYFSTDMVFGGNKISEYSEKDFCKPANYYGKTKYEGEKKIKVNKQNLIIRSNFFGRNTVKGGASFSDNIIKNLTIGKKVGVWGDIFFSPLHIKNLCYALKYLLMKDAKGTYHLSSKKISKYKCAVDIANLFSLDAKLLRKNSFDYSQFVKRPLNMSLSSKKVLKKYSKLKKYLDYNYQLKTLLENETR